MTNTGMCDVAMKEKRYYMDSDGNFVDKDKATNFITRILDDKGNPAEERFGIIGRKE